MDPKLKAIIDTLHKEEDVAKHSSERVLNALASQGYKVSKQPTTPELKTSKDKPAELAKPLKTSDTKPKTDSLA